MTICIMFQPLNNTSLTDHCLRVWSLVKMNPPLRVPTITLTCVCAAIVDSFTELGTFTSGSAYLIPFDSILAHLFWYVKKGATETGCTPCLLICLTNNPFAEVFLPVHLMTLH